MGLNIVKPSKYVAEELLRDVAEEVFSYLGTTLEISVKFACKNCIQGLNKEYRGIDKPTNVLSFPSDDEKGGDIVICESVVEREAKELSYPESSLVLLYFVHGILHIAGYDHENDDDRAKMEAAEKTILKAKGVAIERD